jgi:small nuclear ribonucleoprotein F
MQAMVGKRVVVKSKWGTQYSAKLVSTDSFMNLLLADCVEHTRGDTADDEPTVMDEVLLRCNNVLYIREIPAGSDVTYSP